MVAHSSGDLIRIFFTIVSYIQNNLHNNNNKHISDLVVYVGSAEGRFSRVIDSGPHYRSGHYLTLEKLPSADPTYTT